MVMPLSEQLSQLSVRAKNVEDEVAAAEAEAHEKLEVRRDRARGTVEASIQKVDRELRSFGEDATDNWRRLQAKVAADMDALKANIAQRKHDRTVRRAENHAEVLEKEAAFAIDYALASIEQAELASFDAILARADAEKTRLS